MPRLVVPIFWRPGRAFGGQLDHAVVREDDLGAVGDVEAGIDVDAEVAEASGLLEEGHGVEHDAVADDAAAPGAQHAAGHELEDELLAVDDDGVAGVVAAGIARDDGEALAQHIDDLAFALIAPLGANHDCRLRLGHRIAFSFLIPGGPHTRSLFACGSLNVMLRGPWVGRMRESVHPIPDHISA